MAGGMNKRGSYGPMADRVRSASTGASTAASTGASTDSSAAAAPPAVKHCWVTDRHGRLPGLLLEWQQRGGSWQGRVVRPVPDDHGWVVVEEWLPAELLDPA
jgi:hypothetical protein